MIGRPACIQAIEIEQLARQGFYKEQVNEAEEVNGQERTWNRPNLVIGGQSGLLLRAIFKHTLRLKCLATRLRNRKDPKTESSGPQVPPGATCSEIINSPVRVDRGGAYYQMATSTPARPPGSGDANATTTMGRSGNGGNSNGAPIGWMDLKNMSSRIHVRGQRDKREVRNMESSGGSADLSPLSEVTSNDGLLNDEDGAGEGSRGVEGLHGANGASESGAITYKVYKRRWFGLFQLALLNIIVSWDWLSYAALSTTSSQYYNVSTSAINWLSSSFLFSFVVITPFAILILHRGGPRPAIIIAAILLLLGNWIRYGGTRANNFGIVMFGQILMGLAQPFVLSAPTRYSDLWFTGRGRVAATAVTTLANPFGGALAQLIDPFWATDPSQIPDMVLWISVMSTVACIPSFFIPAKPPTPCSPSSASSKQPLMPSIKYLMTNPEVHMIFIPFIVYVGLFNSISSVINQILFPYGFSETEAGIAGAILIVVGLIASAITSPIINRSKRYLLAIKILVPLVALSYLAFIWAPPTMTDAAVYTILAVLGAASFSLVPVVLEYLCEITYPVSPEVTSAICWSGGQLLGGIFIQIANALTDGPNGGGGGKTPYNMQRNLWFQAVFALVVVPLPLALGMFGRVNKVRLRRVEADKASSGSTVVTDGAVNDVAVEP